jgi:outer membrane protein G
MKNLFPYILLSSALYVYPGITFASDVYEENVQAQEDAVTSNVSSDEEWHFKLGYLQETENTEGQSIDRDGTFMPTYYLFSYTKDWSVWLALHQEYYNFDYGDGSHGTRLNRHEFTLRHQYYTSDNLKLGFSLGFTEYAFAMNNEHGDNTSTTAQRYALQPDWDWSLTDNLTYVGWFAYYEKQNNLEKIQYSRHQIETETGLNYKFTDDTVLKLNFYFNHGWDNGNERYGEFSDPQIRGYLPIQYRFTSTSNGTLIPYFRSSLGGWYYNAGKDRYEHNYFNRFGLRWEQSLSKDWNWFIDYAYEPRTFRNADPDQEKYTDFHYTSAGLSYTF